MQLRRGAARCASSASCQPRIAHPAPPPRRRRPAPAAAAPPPGAASAAAAPAASPAARAEVPRLAPELDDELSRRWIDLDPAGYFIIKLDRAAREARARAAHPLLLRSLCLPYRPPPASPPFPRRTSKTSSETLYETPPHQTTRADHLRPLPQHDQQERRRLRPRYRRAHPLYRLRRLTVALLAGAQRQGAGSGGGGGGGRARPPAPAAAQPAGARGLPGARAAARGGAAEG